MNLDKIKELSVKNEKTIEQIALKLSEETGEVAQALLSATNASGSGYKSQSYDDVREECIDVIMVALSLFYKSGGTDEELSKTIDLKVDKWQSKTRIDDLKYNIEKLETALKGTDKRLGSYKEIKKMITSFKKELKNLT